MGSSIFKKGDVVKVDHFYGRGQRARIVGLADGFGGTCYVIDFEGEPPNCYPRIGRFRVFNRDYLTRVCNGLLDI